MSTLPPFPPHGLSWRTGCGQNRTIYAIVGKQASDDDILIGVMDTRKLAEAVVEAHNMTLQAIFGEEEEEGMGTAGRWTP